MAAAFTTWDPQIACTMHSTKHSTKKGKECIMSEGCMCISALHVMHCQMFCVHCGVILGTC